MTRSKDGTPEGPILDGLFRLKGVAELDPAALPPASDAPWRGKEAEPGYEIDRECGDAKQAYRRCFLAWFEADFLPAGAKAAQLPPHCAPELAALQACSRQVLAGDKFKDLRDHLAASEAALQAQIDAGLAIGRESWARRGNGD